MFLIHLYTLISYLLIALLFSYWHAARPARIMRLSIPLFFIIYVILFTLGYEELQLPSKYSLSIMSVLVAFIALYTIYATLGDQFDLPAYRNERFWVSFGAFINYPGNVLVYAAIPVFITLALWQIQWVLSIISNILYFGAYLCLRK